MPPVSSSGAGVVSAALSGTDRVGTKRMPSARARIWRAGLDFYLPRRNSTADRERDQELLSEIPLGLPAEEVAAGQHKTSTRKGWHRASEHGCHVLVNTC